MANLVTTGVASGYSVGSVVCWHSGMYIRKTVRKTKDGKEYINYLLVECVSTPKGPRQRTICSLGPLAPGPAEEWYALAKKLESALSSQLS
ncbi:MAG TPA: hypothetical protein GXX40_02410, partial [Firmicutes bacterium]|nr:hypothetical protein [Bacillota bacterium]